MSMLNKKIILLFIFLLALVLRFLYFPQNTYFGFDQARDAYAVKEILSGDLKVIGPPTANGVLNHGVLYYYIFAPFYFFSAGDPVAVSVFLRILNAAAIFLIYPITFILFGEVAALIAIFLFAISFEQTQFSLFLNHPSLAVISVLIFYLGSAYWIFRKKIWGFPLSLFGLGLSIQFEFVEVQLIAIFILLVTLFKKDLPKFNIKNLTISLLSFFTPLSSYIISEIKNNFISIKQIPMLLTNKSEEELISKISQFVYIINRHFHDNFAANTTSVVIIFIFLILIIYLLFKKICRDQLIFLVIWFFGGLLVYFFINNDAYFYNTGTSIALLIFLSFLLSKLYLKNHWFIMPFIVLVLFSNIYLITKNNPLGPNQKINPQIGLLLKDEEKVVDFIYGSAKGEDFAVNALTMPYNINTTWSYLFEWYGRKKYGYVPVWGGDTALGFPGGLKVEASRSKLPAKRFLIIEPQEGIPTYLMNSFISNEENYTSTIEKKSIGTIQVWVQQPKSY